VDLVTAEEGLGPFSRRTSFKISRHHDPGIFLSLSLLPVKCLFSVSSVEKHNDSLGKPREALGWAMETWESEQRKRWILLG
jgi:hypothetical protein